MEEASLEVQTDSVVGSGDKLAVQFSNAAGAYAGRIEFNFASPATYKIHHCNQDETRLSTSLPAAKTKIWRFTVSRTSEVRLTVHCNGAEVLDVPITKSRCTYRKDYWRNLYWNRKKEEIYFRLDDTASDFYRPGPGE